MPVKKIGWKEIADGIPKKNTFESVQDMVDHFGPKEFADDFRAYQKKWHVRFGKWWFVKWMKIKAFCRGEGWPRPPKGD